MWNLRNDTSEFTKQKQADRQGKQIYGYQRGNSLGRDKLGVWG